MLTVSSKLSLFPLRFTTALSSVIVERTDAGPSTVTRLGVGTHVPSALSSATLPVVTIFIGSSMDAVSSILRVSVGVMISIEICEAMDGFTASTFISAVLVTERCERSA